MEEKLIELLELKFQEEGFDDAYIVDLNYHEANKKLEIFIDRDSNITIGQCAKINKYLQKHIDEAGWLGEKYTLDVSSPGVGKPLKFPRQYVKNIGREVEVKQKDGTKISGKLLEVTEENLTLEEQISPPQKQKKVFQNTVIPFEEITKTVVKISFK